MTEPDAVVVGGGLAGVTAALDLADAGRRVALVERRRRLGGLTWSTRRPSWWVDNGQHVFLRCCDAYLGFLDRIGSAADVVVQDRLDITVIRPGAGPGGGPLVGRLRRDGLPAPAHLARSLATFSHLSLADRARVGLAAVPLRRLDLSDPALDEETFGAWLGRHGQRPAAIEALWDLITVATVNLPAAEASLTMGAKVFQTGVLGRPDAADIGWSRVPLGRLHGDRAADALARAGVDVRLGCRVDTLDPSGRGWTVTDDTGTELTAGAAVVALPEREAAELVARVLPRPATAELGTSAIVDVHVVYDRRVTDLALAAGIGTPVQWIFDRTASSGLGEEGPQGAQYLAVSLSAADRLLGRKPDDLAGEIVTELPRLFPAAGAAVVLDAFVTKERTATFRATPGSAARRPAAATGRPGLALAGAWTHTGWPATMEGAVRSGHAAVDVVLTSRRAGPSIPRAADAGPVNEEVV